MALSAKLCAVVVVACQTGTVERRLVFAEGVLGADCAGEVLAGLAGIGAKKSVVDYFIIILMEMKLIRIAIFILFSIFINMNELIKILFKCNCCANEFIKFKIILITIKLFVVAGNQIKILIGILKSLLI